MSRVAPWQRWDILYIIAFSYSHTSVIASWRPKSATKLNPQQWRKFDSLKCPYHSVWSFCVGNGYGLQWVPPESIIPNDMDISMYSKFSSSLRVKLHCAFRPSRSNYRGIEKQTMSLVHLLEINVRYISQILEDLQGSQQCLEEVSYESPIAICWQLSLWH